MVGLVRCWLRRSVAVSIAVQVAMVADLHAQIPPEVSSFMEGARTENTHHPAIPAETEQFGKLVGVWECVETQLDPRTGEVRQEARAIWAWRYVLGGFGLQDFWYQSPEDYPYSAQMGRGLGLLQLRVFDSRAGVWRVAMINNTGGQTPGQVFRTFTARAVGEELVMTFDQQADGPTRRIVFSNISANRFEWRAEMFGPDGEDWVVLSRIVGTRVG